MTEGVGYAAQKKRAIDKAARPLKYPRLPRRLREQDRDYPGKKDSIEGSGAANRRDRRAQLAEPAKVHQVSADQRAQHSSDVSDRRAMARTPKDITPPARR